MNRKHEISSALEGTNSLILETMDQIALLSRAITKQEVKRALKSMKNGKATGLDGIPYEVLKLISTKFDEAQKQGKTVFNIQWGLKSFQCFELWERSIYGNCNKI